jgi:hypothetical protein
MVREGRVTVSVGTPKSRDEMMRAATIFIPFGGNIDVFSLRGAPA